MAASNDPIGPDGEHGVSHSSRECAVEGISDLLEQKRIRLGEITSLQFRATTANKLSFVHTGCNEAGKGSGSDRVVLERLQKSVLS